MKSIVHVCETAHEQQTSPFASGIVRLKKLEIPSYDAEEKKVSTFSLMRRTAVKTLKRCLNEDNTYLRLNQHARMVTRIIYPPCKQQTRTTVV